MAEKVNNRKISKPGKTDYYAIKAQCCGSLVEQKHKPTGTVNPDESSQARLHQNVPNPFTENTRIDYYLPKTTDKARLYIYNMQGAQVSNVQIGSYGEGNITIQGGSLQPGIYMYTLVADDRVVDTKQMVLTR